jgi:hypothetical protein
MDDKNIKSILQDALENEILSSQVDLWNPVKNRLVVLNHSITQQGVNMNRSRNNRWLVPVFAAVFLALIITFSTPQGRVWADKLFFVLKLTPYSPTPTPIPSFTPTPYTLDNIQSQISQANGQAGFMMLMPSVLPNGYRFWGAEYLPDKKGTCQWYGYGPQPDPRTNGIREFNGDMFLCQSHKAPYLGYDSVGTPGPLVTVETVYIGPISGQYTAIENFREYLTWEQDGFYMYIVVYGTTENTLDRIYLSKEELTTVAESMNTFKTPQMTATPGTTPTMEAPLPLTFNSVEEIEKYVGYKLLKPAVLPKNFVFAGATDFMDQGVHHVILDYAYGNAQMGFAGLSIEEIPLSAANQLADFRQVYPADAITDIMIGKWPGLYVAGGYKQEEMIYGTPTPGSSPTPVWLVNSPSHDLTWQTDKLKIRITYWANTFYEGRLELEEMLAIGVGMR